jgi:6-phosphofructokinase 2
MIYTVTLNPALDRTLWVEKIRADDSNRIEREEKYAGGKGIDVSKVLTHLGVENRALGFVGGFAGEELHGLLVNQGISCDFVPISGETRTDIVVYNMSTKTQTEFNAQGPVIQPFELMKIIHKIEKIENADVIVVSGSLPTGVHPEIYRKIIELSRAKGAQVFLDTDGDALEVGIRGLPNMIKPNIHELNRLVGKDLKGIDAIVQAARDILMLGVDTVLVSLGAQGMLAISSDQQYHAVPPHVEVINTIGAGDSAVAGFVYGMIQGKDLRESVVYAVAAGTATTLKPGTALCERDDVLDLASKISVTALARHG